MNPQDPYPVASFRKLTHTLGGLPGINKTSTDYTVVMDHLCDLWMKNLINNQLLLT